MLVATANWGLGDGSLAAAPDPSFPGRLASELHRAALRAGFRHDGRYRPIARLGLVLAGDTFDGLVSDRWLDGVRPWERRRQVAERHEDVLRAAWRAARRHVGWVVRLARRGLVVPAADRHGRPVLSARVRVPADVVVLAGDRDVALARLGGGFSSRSRTIGVGGIWEGDGVRIAHGVACDPLAARAEGPTLLQSLAVDLIARFGAALRGRPGGAGFGRKLLRLLVDAAVLDLPQRLAGGMAALGAEDGAWVESAWRRAVDHWARAARRVGCVDDDGVVDAIAAWMHHLPGMPGPSPAIRRMVEILATPLPMSGQGRSADMLLVLGHPGPAPHLVGERVVCLGPPTVAPCGHATGEPVRMSRGACVETGVAILPGRLSAAAILEADEGPGGGREWWPLADDGAAAAAPPNRVPFLEAA